MNLIHMDCRCPQRKGSIENQQEKWGPWPCPSSTGDPCLTLGGPSEQLPEPEPCPDGMKEHWFSLSADVISSHTGWSSQAEGSISHS